MKSILNPAVSGGGGRARVRVVRQNITGDSKHECKVAAHPSPLFSKVDLLSRGLPPGGGEKGDYSERGERVANGPNFYPAITERGSSRV